MRDYWLTQELLKLTGWGYVVICVIALMVAIKLPKSGWGKAIAAAVVIGLASILPWQAKKEIDQSQVKADEFKVRYTKAKALFDERCKTAGEKIYRTVDNVEGIQLLNLRPAIVSDSSQYDPVDQYGYNVGGEEYIRYYLIGSANTTSKYKYVEANQGEKKYAFSTPLKASTSREYWTKGGGIVPLESKSIDHFSARYSVEWIDISTKEDRDSWISGGTLRVIDRVNGEVLGERSGYIFETGMGSTAGQRSPWSWSRYHAKSCPSVNEHNRVFVEKVIKPVLGE